MKNLLISSVVSSFVFTSAIAQEEAPLTFEDIKQAFPSAQKDGTAEIKNYATVNLKDDLIFLNGHDGDQLLQSWGNLPSDLDGLIMPTDASWCITFYFDPIGYVKDDEKEDLDASNILKQKREDQEQANEARKQSGLGSLNITGWAVEPAYNPETNNLEWGITLRDDEGYDTINHEVRILGRKGVMNATLLCGPDQFKALRPILASTLQGFEYTSGNKYSEFKEGDKIAEYGLTGLIVGGSAFVLWKFWKPIGIGLIAVGAGIKKFFNRFTGGSSEGRIS
jgi:uncharacterized membrane-anchored protein